MRPWLESLVESEIRLTENRFRFSDQEFPESFLSSSRIKRRSNGTVDHGTRIWNFLVVSVASTFFAWCRQTFQKQLYRLPIIILMAPVLISAMKNINLWDSCIPSERWQFSVFRMHSRFCQAVTGHVVGFDQVLSPGTAGQKQLGKILDEHLMVLKKRVRAIAGTHVPGLNFEDVPGTLLLSWFPLMN